MARPRPGSCCGGSTAQGGAGGAQAWGARRTRTRWGCAARRRSQGRSARSCHGGGRCVCCAYAASPLCPAQPVSMQDARYVSPRRVQAPGEPVQGNNIILGHIALAPAPAQIRARSGGRAPFRSGLPELDDRVGSKTLRCLIVLQGVSVVRTTDQCTSRPPHAGIKRRGRTLHATRRRSKMSHLCGVLYQR
jgi:hypothetical protein